MKPILWLFIGTLASAVRHDGNSAPPPTTPAPPSTPDALTSPESQGCLAPPSARPRQQQRCAPVVVYCTYTSTEVEMRRVGARWADNLARGLDPVEGWRGYEVAAPLAQEGTDGTLDVNDVLRQLRADIETGRPVETTRVPEGRMIRPDEGYAEFLAGIEAPLQRPVQRTLGGATMAALPDGTLTLLVGAALLLAQALGFGSGTRNARAGYEAGEGKIREMARRE